MNIPVTKLWANPTRSSCATSPGLPNRGSCSVVGVTWDTEAKILVLGQNWMSKNRDLLMFVISSTSNLATLTCKLVMVYVMKVHKLRHMETEQKLTYLRPYKSVDILMEKFDGSRAGFELGTKMRKVRGKMGG